MASLEYCLVEGIDQLGYLQQQMDDIQTFEEQRPLDALITLLPGDGIGPEVTAAAHKVLKRVADIHGHSFDFEVRLIGGAAIDRTQNPLPADTVASCMESSAVFLGAVGGPKWSDPHAMVRPEKGLLELRSVLGVYANLRPVRVMEELIPASPLKAEYLTGVDLVVVRELTGGIYFGKKTRSETVASDLCTYHTHEVERIVRVAARLAGERRNKLCSVDKANVLETSRLWRDVTDKTMAREFPDIAVETLLVDAGSHAFAQPAKRLRCHRYREHVRRHSDRRSVNVGWFPGHVAVRIARRLDARSV